MEGQLRGRRINLCVSCRTIEGRTASQRRSNLAGDDDVPCISKGQVESSAKGFGRLSKG